MAEYIGREDAIAWFMPYAHTGESIDADVVISDIKGMKAADVAPVRHGWWIIDSVGWKIACSDCGCIYLGYNGRVTPNYCPNCGAKMDG